MEKNGGRWGCNGRMPVAGGESLGRIGCSWKFLFVLVISDFVPASLLC